MSVYRIDGDVRNYAYDMNGLDLAQAYDINKNPLLDTTPQPLTVMSYNVQWFTGINSQVEMQQKIINDNNPSIIGFQEFSQDGIVPSVGRSVLGNYTTLRLSNHKNYLAMASKLPLYNITISDFEAQDPEDASRYNETRAYMKAYFNFNGQKICWINTHLAVITLSYIYAQMAEIFALAEHEDYVIITADFNTNFSAFNSAIYENTYKIFVDAGYNVLNNAPLVGITKTYSNQTTASTLADFMSNPDSIIVSGNIDVSQIVFDTTKLQYLNGNVIDHIAVATTILI